MKMLSARPLISEIQTKVQSPYNSIYFYSGVRLVRMGNHEGSLGYVIYNLIREHTLFELNVKA